MIVLIKAFQLLFALSILVFVHELGHFLFARLFKIRVNKFYLFFDWGLSLFKYRPKNSHTEYGIGWLPLGGYCQIAGMVDESLATEGLESEAKPWEFRAKQTWQRLLVMVGGVLFNIILATIIYGAIAYTWGAEKIPMKNIGDNLVYTSVGHKMGLKDGDLPIAIDGKKIKYFEGTILQEIANGKILTVERNSALVDIAVPSDLMRAVIASDSSLFLLDLPAVVDTVLPHSKGAQAGFRKGDEIIAINGMEVTSLTKVVPIIFESRGDSITLTLYNNGVSREVQAYPDTIQGLGIGFKDPSTLFGIEHQSYSLGEAIPAGVHEAYKQIVSYADQLKYVATPEGVSNVGGLGTIGSLFPATFNWQHFWHMTAFLSVILAVMNLLPIPGLDGGHIMFILYEIITGRVPSLKWQTRFQILGMLILLLLMLYANISDIKRFLF